MFRAAILVAALLVSPMAAFGQEGRDGFGIGESGPWDALQGRWEVALSGAGSNDSKFDSGGFGIAGSIGHYLTDDLLVSFRQNFTFGKTEGDSNWSGSSRVAVDYHFDFGRLRPFVGVNAGLIYGDLVTDQFILSPEAGLKYYVLDHTFIFGMVEYQWLTRDSFSDDGQFVYSVGIGFNF